MQTLSDILKQNGFRLYPESLRDADAGSKLFVASRDSEKFIGIEGSFDLSSPVWQCSSDKISLYPLNWENYEALKGILPIAPAPCDSPSSFGTGDRLGMVAAAHVKALAKYPAFPVIAQQSPRELMKENRTFKGVLLDAVMGVLESGYTGKFGADADHIKDEVHLREGASAGYSMYTIDVSDWMGSKADDAVDISNLSREVIARHAGQRVDGSEYTFSSNELTKSAHVYEKAMEQVKRFDGIIREYMSDYDLEISIDEGSMDTTPEDHLYVAEYLKRSGAGFSSLAPKFPGEFQKGVDYMGDVDDLDRSLRVHAAIAQTGGYRLSLHSGSDKFSIYPMFGEITDHKFHIKTSGTSWLQAVRLIASVDPELFREMYNLCLQHLTESKKSYHVDITSEVFPVAVPRDMQAFFDTRDVRQLFHISYGVLLDNAGDRIAKILRANEDAHYSYVAGHIEDHLKLAYRS